MKKEETLDPKNWDQLRALGHKMLDDMMFELERARRVKYIFHTGIMIGYTIFANINLHARIMFHVCLNIV